MVKDGRKQKFDANLPILDGKNQEGWFIQMNVIFAIHDVCEQITNDMEPLPANATDVQRNTHKDAKKKNNKALFLIH